MPCPPFFAGENLATSCKDMGRDWPNSMWTEKSEEGHCSNRCQLNMSMAPELSEIGGGGTCMRSVARTYKRAATICLSAPKSKRCLRFAVAIPIVGPRNRSHFRDKRKRCCIAISGCDGKSLAIWDFELRFLSQKPFLCAGFLVIWLRQRGNR